MITIKRRASTLGLGALFTNMPIIKCEVEKIDLTNDNDKEVPSLSVTCTKCGHCVKSFGQRGRSLKRCLAVMKAECPNGDNNNYYKTDVTVED